MSEPASAVTPAASDYLDVLVLCSAPVNVRPALNLASELANFEEEVRRAPVPIRLRRVFPPTLEQLQRELSANALRLRQPRVFHFLGHGEEDGLWFETADGAGDRVSVTQLRRVFKNTPVQLALLNACWSASSRVLNLCQHLVREGTVQAAIGHGQPVADQSAIVFAQRFYALVAEGKSVGEACQRAANFLAEKGLSGSQEIQLEGDAGLRLGADLAPGERTGRAEDGMPQRGYLPGGGFFCGRDEEFLAIARSLADRGQCAFGVWGMGGIGKTRLALEVARRHAWRYRDGGVVWVDVRDVAPPTTLGLLQRALSRLVPGVDASDPVVGLVKQLNAAPGLVVLDNLETLPVEEHAPLARFLQQVPRNGSRVLLTARTRLGPVEALPDVQTLTLTRGLDDWSGAHYVHRVAMAKGVQALQEVPRESKGRLEGPCARVSRRVSGHPKMIEWAVGVARKGADALDQALDSLSGELEAQLEELLTTGLRLVGVEGQRLLAYLPLFPPGRFMPEAMHAVCEAVARAEAGARDETVPTEPADAAAWVQSGLRQLEQSAFLEFDQEGQVYTFHQTLLDHVQRGKGLAPEQKAAGTVGLLVFYAGYLGANRDNYVAIDRCFDNGVSANTSRTVLCQYIPNSGRATIDIKVIPQEGVS